jgi:hypothetical protein
VFTAKILSHNTKVTKSRKRRDVLVKVNNNEVYEEKERTLVEKKKRT